MRRVNAVWLHWITRRLAGVAEQPDGKTLSFPKALNFDCNCVDGALNPLESLIDFGSARTLVSRMLQPFRPSEGC
jgi:hypothetical protein